MWQKNGQQPMSNYARTGTDGRCATEDGDDDSHLRVRDSGERKIGLQQLLLSRATIRINAALFDDCCVLEHESAVGH